MKSLLDSRKFWLMLSGVAGVSTIGVAGVLTKADAKYIGAIILAVAYQIAELIKGIAAEDAAKAMPPTVSITPPAPSVEDESTAH